MVWWMNGAKGGGGVKWVPLYSAARSSMMGWTVQASYVAWCSFNRTTSCVSPRKR